MVERGYHLYQAEDIRYSSRAKRTNERLQQVRRGQRQRREQHYYAKDGSGSKVYGKLAMPRKRDGNLHGP